MYQSWYSQKSETFYYHFKVFLIFLISNMHNRTKNARLHKEKERGDVERRGMGRKEREGEEKRKKEGREEIERKEKEKGKRGRNGGWEKKERRSERRGTKNGVGGREMHGQIPAQGKGKNCITRPFAHTTYSLECDLLFKEKREDVRSVFRELHSFHFHKQPTHPNSHTPQRWLQNQHDSYTSSKYFFS